MANSFMQLLKYLVLLLVTGCYQPAHQKSASNLRYDGIYVFEMDRGKVVTEKALYKKVAPRLVALGALDSIDPNGAPLNLDSSTYYHYLKFYPDGKILETTDAVLNIVRALERFEYKYGLEESSFRFYELNNDRLFYPTNIKHPTFSYTGTVKPDEIALTLHSPAAFENNTTKVYQFIETD